MTAEQIANRVQQEADARLPEVIERLLFLLDARSDISCYVKKWVQTGLLSDIPEEDVSEVAFALETTALTLIEECIKKGDTSWETNEEMVCRRFKEAVEPFKSPLVGSFKPHACCP